MNLLKALFKVSSLTLVSRILGFVRDTVIARLFGAGIYTDAFFVAFKIPNLLRRLFAEGAFSQAFVPVLAEYRQNKGEEQTDELISNITSLLTIILFIITLIGIVSAPLIIYASAPGFSNDAPKFQIAVDLLRVTFPYILFISLVSLASSILNTYQKFSVPAFTPVFLNLSFIGFALFGAKYFNPPVMALGWAVFFGGLIQLLFQVPYLMQIKKMPKLSWNPKHEGVKKILRQMLPALLGVAVAQISLIINTVFASFLKSGSVSWIYYADRLMEFPVGILGVALGTILLPSLAKANASSDKTKYSKLLDWGLRLTMLLALPSAFGLAMVSFPLITTLFFYGKFSINDIFMTQQALIAYSVGLVGLILIKILAPGFYGKQDIKTPVQIAIKTLIATQVLNIIFIFIIPIEHAGLSLSIGLGACLNAGLLFWELLKRGIYTPSDGWGLFMLNLTAGLVAMSMVFIAFMGEPQIWVDLSVWGRFFRLMALLIGAMVAYFGTLRLLGIKLQDFRRYAEK